MTRNDRTRHIPLRACSLLRPQYIGFALASASKDTYCHMDSRRRLNVTHAALSSLLTSILPLHCAQYSAMAMTIQDAAKMAEANEPTGPAQLQVKSVHQPTTQPLDPLLNPPALANAIPPPTPLYHAQLVAKMISPSEISFPESFVRMEPLDELETGFGDSVGPVRESIEGRGEEQIELKEHVELEASKERGETQKERKRKLAQGDDTQTESSKRRRICC